MDRSSLLAFFTSDHRACDAAWAEVESSVDAGSLEAESWGRFSRALQANLQREESVLFPAFEAATGMTQGPTTVMWLEHHQMLSVLAQMQQSADAGAWDALLDLGDTLMMLVQQHNMKEEGALFPMANQALGDEWAELREALEG